MSSPNVPTEYIITREWSHDLGCVQCVARPDVQVGMVSGVGYANFEDAIEGLGREGFQVDLERYDRQNGRVVVTRAARQE